MRWVLLLSALLWAVPAQAADVEADSTIDTNGCRTWLLCDDQSDTGTCVDGSSNNLIARAGNEYTWTAFAQHSDSVAAWTIKLYGTSPGQGYAAGVGDRALLNFDGDMTPSNPQFSFMGIQGDIHAVLGGTVTDGVTLKLKGCPLR